ncbi:unnamed protein product, partial [Caretta caretta]
PSQEGFHIIQTIYGCDLQEDNTTRGFYQDSYDGRDFLTFDKETVTWVAADIGAQISKRRWDAEIDDNQGWKRYLEEECISWLRSSLEYGKETLQRKALPRCNAAFSRQSAWACQSTLKNKLCRGSSSELCLWKCHHVYGHQLHSPCNFSSFTVCTIIFVVLPPAPGFHQ